MQHIQQVRAGRVQHVAVPPGGQDTLELSREERSQLRAVRSRAFQRHQRNAVWMQEIIQSESSTFTDQPADAITPDRVANGTRDHAPSSSENGTATGDAVSAGAHATTHVEEQQQKTEALRQRVLEQQNQLDEEHRRNEEVFVMLRACTAETLASCREQVHQDTTMQANTKEPKVIKL